MKIEVVLPGPPVRTTSSPGTLRSASATEELCQSRSCFAVITLTVLLTEFAGVSSRVAVTTVEYAGLGGGGSLDAGVEAGSAGGDWAKAEEENSAKTTAARNQAISSPTLSRGEIQGAARRPRFRGDALQA